MWVTSSPTFRGIKGVAPRVHSPGHSGDDGWGISLFGLLLFLQFSALAQLASPTGSTRATTSKRTSVTVAILAQGTSWAVAVTQAFEFFERGFEHPSLVSRLGTIQRRL